LANPKILILDNPFIGLDAEARCQLNELFCTLVAMKSVHLYLVIARRSDIPDYVDDVHEMGNELTVPDYFSPVFSDLSPSGSSAPVANDIIIDMHKVNIRYGERIILRDLDWQVIKGERWALSGQNGSGKSTLLSLVCADNPQGYACDIALFGHQRGTGESIWEIKKRIGYVSPEMHRSYLRDLPTIHVVASGLKDTVGLYIRPTSDDKVLCCKWLRVFGIENLANRSFVTLSSGEQRLALVARAFVKNPDLLILDEPFHGLDDRNRQRVREVIEAFCHQKEKTLIMVTHYMEELPQCINNHLYLKRQ
jgi:molybdate transport system ATP-binding protein